MTARRRLDAEMVRRGLAPSPERAQVEIAEGRVMVSGATADKPGRLVHRGEPVVVRGPGPRFVSRAGAKLAGAVERFSFAAELDGCLALDAGASTGGFTDCLLQYGARKVIAVDVGHNQLHERLRHDPRVYNLERTNLRTLDPELIGVPVDVVVADLAFISLRAVLAPVFGACRSGALYAFLVKPQFEAERVEADRGRGIITDPSVWRRVLDEVGVALAARHATIMGVMVSPLTGADGNVEFMIVGRAPGDGSDGLLGEDGAMDRGDFGAAFDEAVTLASSGSDRS